MSNYFSYFPGSDQSHLGTYQLVSEQSIPRSHDFRQGAPLEQPPQTQIPWSYGPRQGAPPEPPLDPLPRDVSLSSMSSQRGSPEDRRSATKEERMRTLEGTFLHLKTMFDQMLEKTSLIEEWLEIGGGGEAQLPPMAAPPLPQPPLTPEPYCYSPAFPSPNLQQYPTPPMLRHYPSTTPPPQQYANSSPSSWCQQQPQILPPQQQYQFAPHVYDKMPERKEACRSPNCESSVFDEIQVPGAMHIGEHGKVGSFEQTRMRKLGSMSWCRRCKIDCMTMEGLVLHSLTREHQNMTMALVLSIKKNSQSVTTYASTDENMTTFSSENIAGPVSEMTDIVAKESDNPELVESTAEIEEVQSRQQSKDSGMIWSSEEASKIDTSFPEAGVDFGVLCVKTPLDDVDVVMGVTIKYLFTIAKPTSLVEDISDSYFVKDEISSDKISKHTFKVPHFEVRETGLGFEGILSNKETFSGMLHVVELHHGILADKLVVNAKEFSASTKIDSKLEMFMSAYPFLEEFKLKRMTELDDRLEYLVRSFTRIEALSLVCCNGFSTTGLACIISYCKNLVELDTQENVIDVDDIPKELFVIASSDRSVSLEKKSDSIEFMAYSTRYEISVLQSQTAYRIWDPGSNKLVLQVVCRTVPKISRDHVCSVDELSLDLGGSWLSGFHESFTSLEAPNFAHTNSEVIFDTLEMFVVRCKSLKVLKVTKNVSLEQLQRLLVRVPHLTQLGTGSFSQDHMVKMGKFVSVQKAYERLQAMMQGLQGPQVWRLLLLLKGQCILYRRYEYVLEPFKNAGYPMLLNAVTMDTGDNDLHSSERASLLIAASELIWRTCVSSSLNGEELVRDGCFTSVWLVVVLTALLLQYWMVWDPGIFLTYNSNYANICSSQYYSSVSVNCLQSGVCEDDKPKYSVDVEAVDSASFLVMVWDPGIRIIPPLTLGQGQFKGRILM